MRSTNLKFSMPHNFLVLDSNHIPAIWILLVFRVFSDVAQNIMSVTLRGWVVGSKGGMVNKNTYAERLLLHIPVCT